MGSAYRLALIGPVPRAAYDQITRRFGPLTSLRQSDGIVVMQGQVADQSGARALLNMLWDMDADIRQLQIMPLGEAADALDRA